MYYSAADITPVKSPVSLLQKCTFIILLDSHQKYLSSRQIRKMSWRFLFLTGQLSNRCLLACFIYLSHTNKYIILLRSKVTPSKIRFERHKHRSFCMAYIRMHNEVCDNDTRIFVRPFISKCISASIDPLLSFIQRSHSAMRIFNPRCRGTIRKASK